LRREECHRQRDADKARKLEQVLSHIEISPETCAANMHLRRAI